MLTKASLDLIDALSAGREATPKELAAETGYTQAYLYEALDELLAEGILTEDRGSKNQRIVQATDHPVVESYRDLRSKLSHVDWTDILSPATLRVCWYLDEPRRVTDIADRLDITRQGVHDALSPLKNRAMLSPSGPEYALTDDLSPVLAFAREVVTHEHRSRARQVAPSATVEWCDPKRALIRVQTPADTAALESADEWRVTGLVRFQEYGLQFFLAGEPTFWYAPDEDLTPSEVLCHTLLLGRDSRRVSYSMLLIEKLDLDQETLTETATWYGLETVVAAMYRPFEGEFEISGDLPVDLPSEAEFSALKEQYGVS
ncbi:MAG: MarR family transcriptional regulator [Halodesulfurarchaeum sp.]